MIIDIHTHCFPDAIAEKALHRLTENTRLYQDIYGPVDPPYTDATTRGLLASSRASGVDVSVVMPIATSPRPSQTINNFAATVDKLPGLRSFGSVHPKNPEACQELERLKALGLRGIKLHPEYQGCFVDEPETVAVVKKASELGLWVLFHAGQDVGMPPPVHCTPEHVARLREAVPEASIILAHMGGFGMWEEVERMLPSLDVYIDTSYCFPNYPGEWERFARLIRAFGADHVLFGTDSPWADQAESIRLMRTFFDRYHFSKDESNAIFGGNAAKVLGLKKFDVC